MATHAFVNGNLFEQCPDNTDPDLWTAFRRRYHLAESLEFLDGPVQLDVELNSGCNMKCPFCWHGHRDIKNENLSWDAYSDLIKSAVACGVQSLKLNYINEPMMRKDLEAAIRYAKDAGILNVYLATNGSLLNEKRRHSMLSSGITKIFISIDAVTGATYNRQRLNNKYDSVVSNILEFINLRNSKGLRYPLVRVNFLRNTLNQHEEERFREFWQDKADFIAFQNMNDLPEKDTGLRVDSGAPPKVCSFPFKQLVVDHEGDILPCCKMGGKALRLGNIKETTLLDAWRSDEAVALRTLHKAGDYKENPICRRCLDGC